MNYLYDNHRSNTDVESKGVGACTHNKQEDKEIVQYDNLGWHPRHCGLEVHLCLLIGWEKWTRNGEDQLGLGSFL
jgi:hypothetical protein